MCVQASGFCVLGEIRETVADGVLLGAGRRFAHSRFKQRLLPGNGGEVRRWCWCGRRRFSQDAALLALRMQPAVALCLGLLPGSAGGHSRPEAGTVALFAGVAQNLDILDQQVEG